MLLRVDASDALPVYEQLRQQLTAMIAAGTLPVGARLPTIRQLAVDLGLAPGTVNKAYESLVRDGVIRTKGRHGTIVLGPARQLSATERRSRLGEAAMRFAVAAHQLGVDHESAHQALSTALSRLDRKT